MGLDMYLYRRKYVKNWEHNPDRKWSISVKLNGKEQKDSLPVSYVVYDAGYWRKANAIHNWFIQNCAGGDHDRTTMYVGEEQLKELRDLCQKVVDTAVVKKGKVYVGTRWTPEKGEEKMYEDGTTIVNAGEIAELLPTQSGFFFGSTDYDQWYLDDVKETISIIDKALENTEHCEFEYYASW